MCESTYVFINPRFKGNVPGLLDITVVFFIKHTHAHTLRLMVVFLA